MAFGLWPMENTGSYSQISDWAGCPGNYSCPFHGYACGYGDSVHNSDGEKGHGHNGIDIGSSGYVRAAAAGMVYSHNSLDTDRGRYVVIEHPIGTDSSGASWSYYSVYQHLASIVSPLSGRISAGTRIGYSGGSGRSDGQYDVHLHFEVVMDYSGKGQTFPIIPVRWAALKWQAGLLHPVSASAKSLKTHRKETIAKAVLLPPEKHQAEEVPESIRIKAPSHTRLTQTKLQLGRRRS